MKKQSPGSPPKYTEQEKIAIAREYLTSDLGYGQLGRKYGLSKHTIIHFVGWYRKHYPDGPAVTDQGAAQVLERPIKAAAGSAADRAKDQELEQARLKIAALELLLANAKKELGIDLVKKSGTKQSNK
jgi:transposase-like protein